MLSVSTSPLYANVLPIMTPMRAISPRSLWFLERHQKESWRGSESILEQMKIRWATGGEAAQFGVAVEELFFKQKPESAYESPFYFGLLMHIVNVLEKAVSESPKASSYPLRFGTVYRQNVNARAVAIPVEHGRTEYVITLSSGVFALVDHFTYFLMASSAETGSRSGASALWAEISRLGDLVQNQAVRDRLKHVQPYAAALKDLGEQAPIDPDRFFRRTLQALLVHGTPNGHVQRPEMAPHVSAIWYQNCMPMYLFLVGHEYGHLLRGHPEQAATAAAPPEKTANEEFEADYIGWILANNSMMSLGAEFGYPCQVSVLKFFLFLDVVYRAACVLSYGVESVPVSQAYPPPLARLEKLSSAFRKKFDLGNVFAAEYLHRENERLLHQAFERVKPEFETLRREGVKVHPVWMPLIS